MTTFIIICIIVFFVSILSGNKKHPKQDVKHLVKNNNNRTYPSKKEIQQNNDSIIDVTDYSHDNNLTASKTQSFANNVPHWEHQYVYSYSEINYASCEQKRFYTYFKNKFLNGEYIDLNGNTNYAFILLFNLLEEYENHKDIDRLEKQIKDLGQHYPKTRSYGNSFLIKKIEILENDRGLQKINEDIHYDKELYWKLGTKNKLKFNLTTTEVLFFNDIYVSRNQFSNIQFLESEILKLFLSVIRQLSLNYGNKLDDKIQKIAHHIAINCLDYKENSNMYNPTEGIHREIYNCIWKHCENYIRKEYNFKLTNEYSSYYVNNGVKFIQEKMMQEVDSIIVGLLPLSVSPLNENVEIELNALQSNRWKIKFEKLTTLYEGNPTEFVKSILLLVKLNKKHPSFKNIFFEASKFMVNHDKVSALSLFIYYLHYDLKSDNINNKRLPKNIQKSLFKTSEQLHDFEVVISNYLEDKNLVKALQDVSEIYAVKRKKIQLDSSIIKGVEQQHSGTVKLLNEYLKEEEVVIQKQDIETPIYNTTIALNSSQLAVLKIFAENDFSVSHNKIEAFAKSNGIFKNQLIESINEACYDTIDDILIEENENNYTINPDYYQQILSI